MVRAPAVAGQFYPDSPQQLDAVLKVFMEPAAEPVEALMAVSPHAGYIYSGGTAGKVFSRIKVPQKVVLIGPNHRGAGSPVAVMSQGVWRMPLGEVELDAELGGELVRLSPIAEEDSRAHQYEHSLEVQVPFLQYLQKDLLLTPICISYLDLEDCLSLGLDLARAIKKQNQPVLLVSSTDMSHYEPAEQARKRDMRAVDHILALDPQGLFHTVRNQGITMCGVLPTVICLAAALELGASQAELIHYTNSGEASGDFGQVVGYAGLIVS